MVDGYLTGKYGSSEEVGPYIASIFYAQDRLRCKFKIKKWLDEGKISYFRTGYLVSNIGHQGGKEIRSKKEYGEKYVDWLYNLEYNIFRIPKLIIPSTENLGGIFFEIGS
jgi:dTMP kinase